MAVKNYLRMLRERRNISQAELARRLNKTRQAINGFELQNYEPTIDVASQIAAILDVPISAIFQPEGESPIALIAQFGSNEERQAFSRELMRISPSDKLQTVVLAHEGACPRWDWDPRGERTDGAPAIAVPCTTRRQFDEMAIWLRQRGCKIVDCAIGLGGLYPFLTFFAADTKYARDQLSEWQPENAEPLPPVPALDALVMEGQTLATAIRALIDASTEAQALAEKCALLGDAEYNSHSMKMKQRMEELRNRLVHGNQYLVRWSSDHSLLTEALHAAEVKARNAGDMALAKAYFETRRALEDQANTKRAE